MQLEEKRDCRREDRRYRVGGFRPGVGFQPSSIDVDRSLQMMLEFDEDGEPENLGDEDLDTEETWPSRREKKR